MGSHNSDSEGDLVAIRQNFIRILERNKVDLIMCGHSHDYERSKLMNGHYGNEASFNAATHNLSSSSGLYDGSSNSCPYTKDSTTNKIGTVYVLSGSAGQLGGQQASFPHDAMYYSNATNGGSFILDIEDNKLEAKWLCADGVVRDKFTIFKDVKSTKTYTVNPGQATVLNASWPGGYTWSDASTTRSISVNTTSDTLFWVKDPNNCVADTFKLKVLPASNFISLPPYCVGTAAQLNDLSTNNTSGWAWSVNPSANVSINNATAQNPGLTFNTPGIYTVSLISSNAYGSGAAYSQTININSNPTVVSALSSTAICVNQSATLSVGGAATYTWNTALTGANNIISPTVTTVYSVTGVDVNGCISTDTETMIVNPLPVVTASSNPSTGVVCSGNTVTLNGNGAGSYGWSNGITDGAVFTATASATYTLTGTDNNGCQNVASISLTVNPLPVLTITANPVNAMVCNGSTLNLTATGATTYTWSNNITNGSVSTPTASTIYTVTGMLNGCQSSTTQPVTVNALPSVSVSGNSVICNGQTATLVASGANTYSWNTNATTTNIAVSPSSNASYTLTGTDNNGCQNTSVKSITVNPLPVLSISGSSAVCAGTSVTLNATGATTYTWNNNANGSSLIVAPAASGPYNVTGTDANGCTNSTSKLITVNPLPTITINSGVICPGYSFILTPSGASSYSYSSGSATVSPVSTTTYSVTGSNTFGCVSSIAAVATVSVVNTLTVTISGSTTICTGQSVNLTANGASTYTWNTGIVGANMLAAPSSNTVYTVTGGAGSCTNTAITSVVVNPLPVITVVSDRTIVCSGEPAKLTVAGANTYTWSNQQNGTSITVTPTTNITFTVTGTDINGCSKIATITQSVSTCSGIQSLSIENDRVTVYPNPNNGEFNIELNLPGNFTVEIFNAVGERVYSAKLNKGINAINLENKPRNIFL